ncbi:MAG: peptidylprolyl isomerase [Acuticoccus sp.]
MLNALRRGAKTIYAKILIFILVASFAVWGISGFVNQIDPTEVARAGDTPVPANEFARVYQRAMTNTAQQFGRALSAQEAQAIGLPTQVLSQLVTEALQVDAAHELGVDLSDEQLAERIREDATFAGSNGEFDRFRFDQLLANNRYTEAEYIALQRSGAAQEMFVNAMFGGFQVPTPYLEAYNRYRNQTRRLEMITVSDDALGAIANPDEATLRAYYEENTEKFRAPEFRSIATVTLSAEALADPAAVSADEVKRVYDGSGAYGSPERRQVQQIVLDDMDAAQQAAQSINDGTDFAAVLGELNRSMDDADLGMVERTELVDPAVAAAAFGLEADKAAAVEGRFGPVLVRVGAIEPAGKRPLEEVEAEIRQSIALEEANDQVRTLFDSVEDAVAGGARVSEVASRFSLPTRTVEAVSEEGNTPDGTALDPALDADVLATAFSEAEGDDPVPVEVGDAYTWVEVNGVTAAADRPYEDVAGEVLIEWTSSEKAARIERRAEEARKAIAEGKPLADVAAELGVDVATTEPFSQSSPAQGVPTAAMQAAFEGPLDHTAAVADGTGNYVVLKVAEVSEPAFFEEDSDLQGGRSVLSEGMVDTMLSEFVSARQSAVGATVNQPVLNEIIGLGQRQ